MWFLVLDEGGGGRAVVFVSTGIHRSQGGVSGTEEAEGSRVTTGKDQVRIRVLILGKVFMLSGAFPKSILVFKRDSSCSHISCANWVFRLETAWGAAGLKRSRKYPGVTNPFKLNSIDSGHGYIKRADPALLPHQPCWQIFPMVFS